jgi:PAS domain S-box-containing protein
MITPAKKSKLVDRLSGVQPSESQSVRQGADRYQLLVEAVRDYAIFMLDPSGHVTTWNAGAERIKGYRASEIIGKHISSFYPEEDVRNGKPQRELEIAERDGRIEDEGWRVRKDGSRFWASVIVTALRTEQGELAGFGRVTRDMTERMQAYAALEKSKTELENQIAERFGAEQKLHESEQSLKKLSLHLLRSQDEERRRIGRDLHDSVGQYLAALKMNLESLNSVPNLEGGGSDGALLPSIGLLEAAIKEVRTLSYLLYPPMLEETGLKYAIQWYLDGFTSRSGVNTILDIPDDFGRLPRDVELAIFRVLQESLTNVHRHSGSATARVLVFMKDDTVRLEVRDKGKGIPRGIIRQSQDDSFAALGVGLRGMNERVRQLGGKLELISTPAGTAVVATIPKESSHSP